LFFHTVSSQAIACDQLHTRGARTYPHSAFCAWAAVQGRNRSCDDQRSSEARFASGTRQAALCGSRTSGGRGRGARRRVLQHPRLLVRSRDAFHPRHDGSGCAVAVPYLRESEAALISLPPVRTLSTRATTGMHGLSVGVHVLHALREVGRVGFLQFRMGRKARRKLIG
jgi:hypothetical protein